MKKKYLDEYYPLPFSYAWGKIFIESEVSGQPDRLVATISELLKPDQTEAFHIQDKLGTYLAKCANLMPIAEKFVKHAIRLEQMHCERCRKSEIVKFSEKNCGCCDHHKILTGMYAFLCLLNEDDEVKTDE